MFTIGQKGRNDDPNQILLEIMPVRDWLAIEQAATYTWYLEHTVGVADEICSAMEQGIRAARAKAGYANLDRF